jgi:hypothetical protein
MPAQPSATSTVLSAATGTSARRADAGSVRLGERDVAGLLLCGDMFGGPYDLLASFLRIRPDRLEHIRAVLAIRLSLEASDAYRDGRAWWRSERRIGGHVPDAEVFWPDEPASGYAGQCWAIEAELTPKPLARTAAIMAGLLARSSDCQPAPDSPARFAASPLRPAASAGDPGL